MTTPNEYTTLHLTDRHGKHVTTMQVAATDAAEATAVEYLRKVTAWPEREDYLVFEVIEVAETVGGEFQEFLDPTCEHGLRARLCAGPDHYPSAEQEREWGW